MARFGQSTRDNFFHLLVVSKFSLWGFFQIIITGMRTDMVDVVNVVNVVKPADGAIPVNEVSIPDHDHVMGYQWSM